MRFKFDENFPEVVRTDLAALGHDVATCAEEGLTGGSDPNLAAHASNESRILLTCDLDFSDIRRYPPGSHAGIVLFRLHLQAIPACRRAILDALSALPENDFVGNLVIIEDARIRIRRPTDQP